MGVHERAFTALSEDQRLWFSLGEQPTPRFTPPPVLVMRAPGIVRRAEAKQRDDKHHRITNPGLVGPKPIRKKKRADKLRAMAGAFSAEAAVVPSNPLEGKYLVQECVGHGKAGVLVSRCTCQATGRTFAVKRVPKALPRHEHFDERAMQRLLAESTHLLSVNEVLEGPDETYHIMDFAAGGDLFEYVRKHGALSEEASRSTFTGILTGLHQLHRAGYIHRDVKPENVLLMEPKPNAENVRLADFEFCCTPPAVGPVGSIAYAAPETLDSLQPYGAAVDMWAVGAILYMMLSASTPFEGVAGHVDFVEPCWNEISSSAKNLIQGLLNHDPASRTSLEEALLHPWVSGTEMAVEEVVEAAPAPRPKFAIRCTWHGKEKRWSNMGGDGAANEVHMFVEQPATPFVACPLEWQPAPQSSGRTNSM